MEALAQALAQMNKSRMLPFSLAEQMQMLPFG